MDFLQTIFKINIFLLRILEIYMAKNSRIWHNICPYSYESKVRQKTPDFHAKYVPIVMNQKWGKKTPDFHAN